MTTQSKLAEIDARALALDMTLSALATEAHVSAATMAKMRRDPSSVRVRVFSKLERALAEKEGAR